MQAEGRWPGNTIWKHWRTSPSKFTRARLQQVKEEAVSQKTSPGFNTEPHRTGASGSLLAKSDYSAMIDTTVMLFSQESRTLIFFGAPIYWRHSRLLLQYIKAWTQSQCAHLQIERGAVSQLNFCFCSNQPLQRLAKRKEFYVSPPSSDKKEGRITCCGLHPSSHNLPF